MCVNIAVRDENGRSIHHTVMQDVSGKLEIDTNVIRLWQGGGLIDQWIMGNITKFICDIHP